MSWGRMTTSYPKASIRRISVRMLGRQEGKSNTLIAEQEQSGDIRRMTPWHERRRKKFWAGLAMQRLIKSLCRARSTPFYLIRSNQQVIECNSFTCQKKKACWLVPCCLSCCALRAPWSTCAMWVHHAKRAGAKCVSNPGPPILGPRSRAFFRTGPPCRVCPCLPPPDQLTEWAWDHCQFAKITNLTSGFPT